MPSGSWRSVAASIALVAALAVVLAARLQDGGGTRALLQRGASLHLLPRSIVGSENAEHGARIAAEEAVVVANPMSKRHLEGNASLNKSKKRR